MSGAVPGDDGWAERVRASFARQGAMAHIGAELIEVTPGAVRIAVPFAPALAQQHGLFHGGIAAMIADSAGGYAALTLAPAGSEVLTVEFKLNLMAPAKGDRLEATGQVVRAGRTLTICELTVSVVADGRATETARGLQTIMRIATPG